ncbi:terpene synthase family protein [Streptomyces sp. NBC_01800]|uniref:terpene synthase family protein n=1 Tax=Streptomyces sp. NBC_01800 TaxID=2975945 RepID=UPI002DD89F78|nr:terpene cyclase [Streptomyces sp. NBC_01800]WSA66991.1 terpene cyclase [Streptomyces sp. NBC_01800]
MENELPDIYCPFPQQTNPHVAHTRAHLDSWTRSTGLVHRDSARERFEQADFGAFVGMVYPTANAENLDLVADWFVWLFLVDDQLDDGHLGRSPDRVRDVVALMRAVVQGTGAGPLPDEELPAAVVALTDLWERTTPNAAAHWLRRFAWHLITYLTTATTWEAGNRAEGVVPSEETYIAKRRHTGAIHVCMDLIEIVAGIQAPESIHNDPRFIVALEASCNVVCWANDVYSYEKEQVLGEIHNLVHLVRHHRGYGKQQALEHVCAEIARETERFLAAEAELVTAYPLLSGMLVPYLNGMRSWMRGNLDWSRQTPRYNPADVSQYKEPQQYLEPTVLGLRQD